jgi:hypothetical protein
MSIIFFYFLKIIFNLKRTHYIKFKKKLKFFKKAVAKE